MYFSKRLVLFVLVVFAVQSWGYPLDYTTENIQLVLADGRTNDTKVAEFRDRIVLRRTEVLNNLKTNEGYLKENDSDKIAKKIRKDKTLAFFDLILHWLDQLKQDKSLSYQDKKSIEGKILELDLALRSDIDPVNTIRQLARHIREFSQKMIIKRETSLGEAQNLYHPQLRRILTQAEIQSYIQQGVDLSLFDPVPNNGVLESYYDIEKGSASERFAQGQNPLHRGVEVHFPKENAVHYDEIRKKQSRPKITVFTKDEQGVKREYKLKLAMELHGEPTSAALSNALGIYSDLTKYVRGIKLLLGKTSFDKFRLEWNSYYSSYDLDQLIKEKGEDSDGQYIIFHDGLLEPELDEDILQRAGPWYWGAADHKHRREFRGLLLFNIWIHNTDLKEGENNKLILRKKADGQFDFYFVQQDLGFSFGHYFRERPTDFSWDIVDQVAADQVVFNYRNFQPNSGFEHVTWADAKWMVRKIARLSRAQIEEAVSYGQWPKVAPYNYHALIVEKLIARRNQMVRAFGLEGEVLSSGERIELMSENRAVEAEAIPSPKSGVPGYTVDFSPELKSKVRDVVLEKIGKGLKEGTISLIGAINNISVDPEWLGWDKGIVTQVVLHVNRTIVKNPNPKNANEIYLVRDDFKIGARLGYGLVISGDIAYVRGFSLIYPKTTHKEALDGPRYITEIIKHGYDEIESSLPKGHILTSESYLEGRGKFQVDGGTISIGYEATVSRIELLRTLISRKKAKKLVFFEDESLYTELAHRIYTRLGFVKITHFKWAKQTGKVDRNLYELEFEKAKMIDRAIFANDFSMLKEKAEHKQQISEYWHKTSKINLLGFWKRNKDLRRDLVDIWSVDSQQKVYNATKLVVEMSTEQNWSFIRNGEDHYKRVQYVSDLSMDRKAQRNSMLRMSFIHVDKNATTGELEDGYLTFIDGLTGRKNFLNFTPSLHAFQDGWGELNIKTEIEIDEHGIEHLRNISEEQFYQAIMNRLGLVGFDLSFYAMNTNDRDSSIEYFGRRYTFAELQTTIQSFLNSWRKLLETSELIKTAETMAVALYDAGDRSGDSFQPLIYRALLDLIPEEHYFISAHIFVPEHVENKLPGKYSPYNQLGEQKKSVKDQDRLLFHMTETWNVYQTF